MKCVSRSACGSPRPTIRPSGGTGTVGASLIVAPRGSVAKLNLESGVESVLPPGRWLGSAGRHGRQNCCRFIPPSTVVCRTAFYRQWTSGFPPPGGTHAALNGSVPAGTSFDTKADYGCSSGHRTHSTARDQGLRAPARHRSAAGGLLDKKGSHHALRVEGSYAGCTRARETVPARP